jgi:hypothetical protein
MSLSELSLLKQCKNGNKGEILKEKTNKNQ